jgi:tetratricopeptide (TPR) repeat protein
VNYDDFVATARKAFDLAETGDLDGGIKVFQELIETDLPEKDKAYMCLNIAALFHRKGDKEQALAWYGNGVEHDSRENGRFAMEQRAAYLAGLGRVKESLADFHELLKHPTLTNEDKDRIKKNITFLQAKMD